MYESRSPLLSTMLSIQLLLQYSTLIIFNKLNYYRRRAYSMHGFLRMPNYNHDERSSDFLLRKRE
jgi:hypothetical protein